MAEGDVVYTLKNFESTSSQEQISNLQKVIHSCMEHFLDFPNDEDAALMLVSTFRLLSDYSSKAGIIKTSDFCIAIIATLECSNLKLCLKESTIDALQKCVNLIDWQIELFDSHKKLLDLDDTEQNCLLINLKNQL